MDARENQRRYNPQIQDTEYGEIEGESSESNDGSAENKSGGEQWQIS